MLSNKITFVLYGENEQNYDLLFGIVLNIVYNTIGVTVQKNQVINFVKNL